jgi:hypothetical protein
MPKKLRKKQVCVAEWGIEAYKEFKQTLIELLSATPFAFSPATRTTLVPLAL